jgi:hypothetical protein
MLGPFLLVATIYEENCTTRPVYLPRGEGAGWFDFHTGTEYKGGCEVIVKDVDKLLDHIPLFVRGNAILPMILTLRYFKNTEELVSGSEERERCVFVFPSVSPEPAIGESFTFSWLSDLDENVSISIVQGSVIVAHACTIVFPIGFPRSRISINHHSALSTHVVIEQLTTPWGTSHDCIRFRPDTFHSSTLKKNNKL